MKKIVFLSVLITIYVNACSSNYDCGYGNSCVKKRFSSNGICMKNINHYGIKRYKSPRLDFSSSVGNQNMMIPNYVNPYGGIAQKYIQSAGDSINKALSTPLEMAIMGYNTQQKNIDRKQAQANKEQAYANNYREYLFRVDKENHDRFNADRNYNLNVDKANANITSDYNKYLSKQKLYAQQKLDNQEAKDRQYNLEVSAIYQNNEDKKIFTIEGNGKQCYAIFTKEGQLHGTDCLSLTNSKGIRILCTEHKKVCKTEHELIYDKSPHDNNVFVTDKGTRFGVAYNKHGAIFKSKSFTISVGNSCDLTSSHFGRGTWRDRGKLGFSLFFKNKVIIFSNQQIHINNNGQCL